MFRQPDVAGRHIVAQAHALQQAVRDRAAHEGDFQAVAHGDVGDEGGGAREVARVLAARDARAYRWRPSARRYRVPGCLRRALPYWSTVILPALMMAIHFSLSAFMRSASSRGVPPVGTRPRSRSRFWISGLARMRLMEAFS